MSSRDEQPSATMTGMRNDEGSKLSRGDQPAPDVSPLQALRDLHGSLGGAAARAAGVILAAPARAARSSITELARYCDVSPATLSRLATTLGYDGFVAMRAAIATEHGREIQGGWQRDIGTKIAPDDEPAKVLSVLVASQNQAARNATSAVDLAAANRAAEWIAEAGRIHLYGDWGDSVSLYELYLRLLRIGRPVWFQDSHQGSKLTAGLLGPGDVLICLARSGKDEVSRAVSAIAKSRGAHTVVITGDPDADLGRAADVTLFTGTRPGSSWTDYFGGRASDHLVASLLWVLVAQRVPDGLGVSYSSPAEDSTPDLTSTHPAAPEKEPETPS